VNNAMRHAQPKTIRLHLRSQGAEGSLTIEDDGHGLPKAKAKKASKGIGLRVMDYRAQIIEGDVQILPRKGGGAQVVCRFPLPAPKRRKRKTA
jgi:signal transduction histidine kinase